MSKRLLSLGIILAGLLALSVLEHAPDPNTRKVRGDRLGLEDPGLWRC